MNKERKTLTHKFGDARCRLPPCRVEGCCWVGDKFLAITKKCLEVGGYVQRWEDAAGGYRKKVFLGAVPIPMGTLRVDSLTNNRYQRDAGAPGMAVRVTFPAGVTVVRRGMIKKK